MANIPQELILEQIPLGPMDNFLYFIGDAQTKEIAVVDPAWDVGRLCQIADEKGYTIKAILLTHGHPDHINGLEEMLERHDVPVYVSKHEAGFYKPEHPNNIELDDGDTIKIGNIELSVLHTPGHTPGCQCFRYKNVMIVGDLLFIDGCGRCDLPGGDAKQMYHSLYDTIKKLPDETIVFPGHDYGPKPFDTLGGQKKTNPYLVCDDEKEFLQQRMGVAY